MNLESVKLSQLRSLVAVAAHGNFSEAALHLEVSQSAVSHAIASLEDELGVVLLSRGRHGANLTPIGEQILCHAQEILHLVEVIGKEASLSKGLHGGHVRIVSIRSAATHLLPSVIAQFRQRFPKINITLLECRGDDQIEQHLREGRAEVGIICLPPADDLQTWELMRDEYIVLLPPDANVPGEQLTWEDLATYPLIMPPRTDYCSVLIRAHLTRLGQPINAAYEIHEDSTIVSMVMQGLGATIIARLAAEPLPPEARIYHLPVRLERVIRSAVVTDALHSPAVYAFLDTLKQVSQSSYAAWMKKVSMRSANTTRSAIA